MAGRAAVVAALAGLFTATAVVAQEQPLLPTTWNGTKYGCKCYPGDDCWPTRGDWGELNKTVDGNLAVIAPPGAVCHESFKGLLGTSRTYDAAKCAEVTANFGNEQWQWVPNGASASQSAADTIQNPATCCATLDLLHQRDLQTYLQPEGTVHAWLLWSLRHHGADVRPRQERDRLCPKQ